ncbi:MAG: MATE family efflux transporter [Acholeplasmataceae bacterium]
MDISIKEQKRRDSILNDSLWKVFLAILIPIAMYNFLIYLFGVFDLKIISMFPNDPKDSVAFFDEIKNAISAFGTGFATGGAVIVANLYGKGDIREARRNAGVVLILTLIISAVIITVTVLGVIPILKALNFNRNIIAEGQVYFYIQISTTALNAINVVFIGLERAKKNTKTIIIMNISIAVIKVVLTLVFVFGFGLNSIEWIAMTTLLAQLSLTVFVVFQMFNKKNIFKIDLKDLSFNKKYVKDMIKISIPIVLGRFTFSFGKVIVNYFATVYYGAASLAALSITYKANLGFGAIASTTEEASATIISQNVGNKNPKRAFRTVWIAFIYTLILTVIGVVLITLLADYAVKFFIAKPAVGASAVIWDEYYMKIELAKNLLMTERFSMMFSAFVGVFLGGFFGFKITKLSYIANAIRIFIFRIPILILLHHFSANPNYINIGKTMVLSNLFTAISVMVMFMIFYFKHKANNFAHYLEIV